MSINTQLQTHTPKSANHHHHTNHPAFPSFQIVIRQGLATSLISAVFFGKSREQVSHLAVCWNGSGNLSLRSLRPQRLGLFLRRPSSQTQKMMALREGKRGRDGKGRQYDRAHGVRTTETSVDCAQWSQQTNITSVSWV